MQKKLGFDFTKLRLRLGPKWFDFQLKPGQLPGTKCAACSVIDHALCLLNFVDHRALGLAYRLMTGM